MIEALKNLPPEISVFLIASLPIFELRGSIPIGVIYFSMPLWKVFMLSILGNMFPVPVLLLLFEPISHLSQRWSITKKFFLWLYKRAQEKGVSVGRLKALGLYLFVALPVPGTGAWMGSLVAKVFNLGFVQSFISILLGVLTAGFVITFVSSLGILAVILFFCAIFILSYRFLKV